MDPELEKHVGMLDFADRAAPGFGEERRRYGSSGDSWLADRVEAHHQRACYGRWSRRW